MTVLCDAGALSPEGCGVAIGFFDGVHLGHRKIIESLVARCKSSGFKSVVMTFEPHPLESLKPGYRIERLTSQELKTSLIGQLGVDYVYVRRFDQQLSMLTPAAFVDQVLLKELNARLVFVGFNFTFGYGASGGAKDLRTLLAPHGVSIEIVEPVICEGWVVSSTAIRELVKKGHVNKAAKLLGRPFQVTAVVLPGEGRGRRLGFPTANLNWPAQIVIPKRGVYTVTVNWGEGERLAVANLGPKPTFHSLADLLEVHVIDYAGSLYGREMTVRFLKWIRPQKIFQDEGHLIDQIKEDITCSRRFASEMFTRPVRYGRIKQ